MHDIGAALSLHLLVLPHAALLLNTLWNAISEKNKQNCGIEVSTAKSTRVV
jgi:hypothetical protein